MYAYIDSFRKFGKTNTDNQSIKIKRPYPTGSRLFCCSCCLPRCFALLLRLFFVPNSSRADHPFFQGGVQFGQSSVRFLRSLFFGSCACWETVLRSDFRYTDCRGFSCLFAMRFFLLMTDSLSTFVPRIPEGVRCGGFPHRTGK